MQVYRATSLARFMSYSPQVRVVASRLPSRNRHEHLRKNFKEEEQKRAVASALNAFHWAAADDESFDEIACGEPIIGEHSLPAIHDG